MPGNPNTAEPQKPRRRWYQFRLRTLLVGTALLSIPCGYVGNEWRIVATRWNWLLHHRVAFGVYNETDASAPKLPYVRRLLGDHSLHYVFVSTPDEEQIGKELFPEAQVSMVAGIGQ